MTKSDTAAASRIAWPSAPRCRSCRAAYKAAADKAVGPHRALAGDGVAAGDDRPPGQRHPPRRAGRRAGDRRRLAGAPAGSTGRGRPGRAPRARDRPPRQDAAPHARGHARPREDRGGAGRDARRDVRRHSPTPTSRPACACSRRSTRAWAAPARPLAARSCSRAWNEAPRPASLFRARRCCSPPRASPPRCSRCTSPTAPACRGRSGRCSPATSWPRRWPATCARRRCTASAAR